MKRFLSNIDKTLFPCILGAIVVIIVFQVLGGNDALGWISSVLQVVTVALAVSAWLSARAILIEREDVVKKAKTDQSSVVLIIDIGNKNIAAQVVNYAKTQGIIGMNEEISFSQLKTFIPDGFVVEYSPRIVTVYSEGDMPMEGMETGKFRADFVETLNTVTKYMRQDASSTVHLFCSCPIVLSYYVGEALKNNFNVIVYHYTKRTSDRDSYVAV